MLSVSAIQLRAARAMLNWSRVELAKHSGVSEPTLHRLENGQSEPSSRTQNNLRMVLEAAGIEFTDNNGVRFRPEGMDVLQGQEGAQKFFDQVYAYAQKAQNVIRQNNINDEILFRSALAVAEQHKTRMEILNQNKQKIRVRVLVQEGSRDFQCPSYAQYKWFAQDTPMPVPYYVFGDHVGIFAIEQNRLLRIYLISSPIIATAYANQFDEAWKLANNPDK